MPMLDMVSVFTLGYLSQVGLILFMANFIPCHNAFLRWQGIPKILIAGNKKMKFYNESISYTSQTGMPSTNLC
jgi:hypothetical protein